MKDKKDAGRDFYNLIDRLQELYFSNRQGERWDNDTYYATAWAWTGKEDELKVMINQLEKELIES